MNVDKIRFQKNSTKYKNLKKIERFLKDLCESYSVLKDPKKKAFYDYFGCEEFKKKWKVLLSDKENSLSWKGKLDSFVKQFVYENTCLNKNQTLKEFRKGNNWKSQNQSLKWKQQENIVVTIEVTLKQIYMRDMIRVKYKRMLIEPFSKSHVTKTFVKKLVLGYYLFEFNEMKFKGEGHLYYKQENSDLIFNFKILPIEGFIRKGIDLILKKRISLKDALVKSYFKITHLDGEELDLLVDKTISPNTVFKIVNKGLYRVNPQGITMEDEALFDQTFQITNSNNENQINYKKLNKSVIDLYVKDERLLEEEQKTPKIYDIYYNPDLENRKAQSEVIRLKNLNIQAIFEKDSLVMTRSTNRKNKLNLGHLYVYFEIDFPNKICPKKLNRIKSLLED